MNITNHNLFADSLIFKYYIGGFRFDSEKESNDFIKYIIDIGNNYLKFLIYKGKLFLPFEMNTYDASVDLLAELFTKENKQFIKFYRHFLKFEPGVINEINFKGHLDSFIFTVIHNNLINLYRVNDPSTYGIIKSIKDYAERNGYYISYLFTDKYLHRTELEFDRVCMPKDDLLNLINSTESNLALDNINKFMNTLFDALENQDEYLPAAGLSDIVYVYKQLLINKYYTNNENNNLLSVNEYSVDIEVMIENIKLDFLLYLNKYYLKTGFSELSAHCMYNIIDDVVECYKSGSRRKSVKKLVDEYFPEELREAHYDKAEYCLHLLNDRIIKTLKTEGIIR